MRETCLRRPSRSRRRPFRTPLLCNFWSCALAQHALKLHDHEGVEVGPRSPVDNVAPLPLLNGLGAESRPDHLNERMRDELRLFQNEVLVRVGKEEKF